MGADGKNITIRIDTVQGKTGGAKKVTDDLEREVIASQQRIDRAINQSEKARRESKIATTREALNQEKILERSTKNYLRSVENASRDSAKKMRGIFGDVFAGTFLGMSAATAVSAGLGKAFGGLQTAFQKSLDFSQMKVSLAQFEGSMEAAETRIKTLMKVAAETPGLSFLSAVDGQKRLMAIGFAGDQATTILKGLSKVRVLSGSTKEDFDAMIVNLVQIASGGQKVTQEVREMATRMPALVGIIKDEFGGIGKELNAIDPKEFINRLANAAAKTKADFNSTSLAVENLQDSFDRLYIAIGSIVEKNPDLLAALNMFTREINANTDALADNESQTRSTFGTWVSWAAKGSISAVNFVEKVGAAIQDTGTLIGNYINWAIQDFYRLLRNFGKAINDLIITPLNFAKNKAAQIPIFGLPFASHSDIPLITAGQGDTGVGARGAAQRLMSDLGKNYTEAERRSNARWQVFGEERDAANARSGQPGTPFGGYWKRHKQLQRNAPLGDASGNAGGGSGRVGGSRAEGSELISDRLAARFQAALRKLPPDLKAQIIRAAGMYGIPESLALAQMFSESTFNTGAVSPQGATGLTQGMPGTTGQARFGSFTSKQMKDPKNALTFWGKYMTFLFNRYGDWDLAVLAYHQGEGTVDKLVAALDLGKTGAGIIGPKGRAYVKQVSGLAGLGGKERYQSDALARGLRSPTEIQAFMRSGGRVTPHGQFDVGGGDFSNLEIRGRDEQVALGEKQIEQNNDLIAAYKALDDAMFNVNERTEEEIMLRRIRNGELPGDVGSQLDLVKAARQVDAMRSQKKADEERQDALDKYREDQKRMFEETQYFFEDKLNALIGGGFKGLWKSILDDMKQNFVRQFSQLLAQAFGGGRGGGQAQQGGIGGMFGNIFGGLFGGGQGPGGTPNFNPDISIPPGVFGGAASGGGIGGGSMWPGWGDAKAQGQQLGGGGSGIGGMFGNLKGMFGPQKNLLTGKMSGLGGKLGGIGSIAAMAGSMIPGKWGNLISMAGMGMSIGANFGPWGAAIGAGIGGVAGLIMALFGGGDNGIKKLKEAALSTYGITVKDKAVLNSLKQLGETMFGKGKVGANAVAVVSSDQGQNILRNYAEATGQSSKMIDRLYYGDENWSGNQFRSQFSGFSEDQGKKFGGFRGRGGFVRGGTSYIVGEHRAEMFTPKTDGHISPTVGGAGNTMQMQIILGQVEETLHMLATRLQTMSPGHVLSMGAKENPGAIRDGYESEMQADGRAAENQQRYSGLYR